MINHRKSLQNYDLITIHNTHSLIILRSRACSLPLLLRSIQNDTVPLLHGINLRHDPIPAKTAPIHPGLPMGINAHPYVNVQNHSSFTIQLIALNYAPNSQHSHHHHSRALLPSLRQDVECPS